MVTGQDRSQRLAEDIGNLLEAELGAVSKMDDPLIRLR